MARKTTSRRCFVSGCRTSSCSLKIDGDSLTSFSLFRAPKDPELLQEWQRAIPQKKDRKLASHNAVCELHFPKECIIRNYETILPDGTIDKIPRGRPVLKANAVPCIFPNLPSYFTKIPNERRPPLPRAAILQVKKDYSLQTTKTGKNIGSNENQIKVHKVPAERVEAMEFHEVPLDKIMFNGLKASLNNISMPSPNWVGFYVPGLDEVVFIEWTKTHTCLKKIIIKSDMSFKVLLGTTEEKMLPEKIYNLNEIGNLLKKVHEHAGPQSSAPRKMPIQIYGRKKRKIMHNLMV